MTKPNGEDTLTYVGEPRFRIKNEELCKLMQLKGIEVKTQVDSKYGGIAELCKKLHTDPINGLTDDPASLKEREAVYGCNKLPLKKSKSLLQLMWKALKEPTLIILELAAVVSLAVSLWSIFRPNPKEEHSDSQYEWIEAVAIIIAVLVIVMVSAINDYGKEKQFRALQEQVKKEHHVNVIRNGAQTQIPSDDLLVGDICVLKYGDIIPADGLLLSAHDLRIDESSLTGESDHVRKEPHKDMHLLSGTNVMEGTGKVLVTAVGVNSQSGQIFALLGATGGKKDKKKVEAPKKVAPESTQSSNSEDDDDDETANKMADPTGDEQSVLQKKLTKIATQIGKVGLIFGVGTAIVIIIRFCVKTYVNEQKEWDSNDIFEIMNGVIIGITILVVAIPEGLPLAVTLTLAVSAKKMMKDNNLVRHLFACETMGCATTICSDKTGTLTTNRMTVMEVFAADQHSNVPLKVSEFPKEILDLISTGLSVNSSYTSNVTFIPDQPLPVQNGNKTECSLLQLVNTTGYDYRKIRTENPEENFAKVYPFNSARKSMTTILKLTTGWRVFTKGAAEIILEKCDKKFDESGKLSPLSDTQKHGIRQNIISKMASNGLRTICLAYKDISLDVNRSEYVLDDEEQISSGLTLLGIFGIEDPVRPEVPEAIKQCHEAGVTVRMVTGDNLETAISIATKCGIIRPEEISSGAVLDSTQFNAKIRDEKGQINQDVMDKVWPNLRVLARSTPQDKYNLVNGIKSSKLPGSRDVVAVTGDGTNDAPALKKADVGFAMGIAGTDVAKEASDIILTDDNFTSIVKAAMWGRNIYDNICKFLQFQLTVNVSALIVSITAASANGSTPLKAVPMLWINLIQDTLASLALATEPPSEELLKRKPYGRKANILSRLMIRNILGTGIYQLTILFLIVFGRNTLWGFLGRDLGYSDPEDKRNLDPKIQTNLDTLTFNAFVFMTIFNLLNSRSVQNERNIFRGIHRNPVFIVVILLMIGTQAIVVEVGGQAFRTSGLEWQGWLFCLIVGLGGLVWYQLIAFIPPKLRFGFSRITRNLRGTTSFELKTSPA